MYDAVPTHHKNSINALALIPLKIYLTYLSTKESYQYKFHIIVIGFNNVRTKPPIKYNKKLHSPTTKHHNIMEVNFGVKFPTFVFLEISFKKEDGQDNIYF